MKTYRRGCDLHCCFVVMPLTMKWLTFRSSQTTSSSLLVSVFVISWGKELEGFYLDIHPTFCMKSSLSWAALHVPISTQTHAAGMCKE